MEVDPQEFGEVVTTVKMLKEASVVHAAVTEKINAKLDTVLIELAVRKGEEIAKRRYQNLIVLLTSAGISGCVTWAIDFARHL